MPQALDPATRKTAGTSACLAGRLGGQCKSAEKRRLVFLWVSVCSHIIGGHHAGLLIGKHRPIANL